MNAQSALMEEELAAWRDLAIARGMILAAVIYDTSPTEAIAHAQSAEAALRMYGIDPVTGKDIPS